MELGVLLNGLELLDTVNLERFLTSLVKESLGLSLQLIDIFIKILTVESGIIVVLSFNHSVVSKFKKKDIC